MADTIQLFTSRGKNGMTMPRILYERLCEHILSMIRRDDAISLADLIDHPEETSSDLEQFIDKEMLPLYLLNVKIDLHARNVLHVSLLGRTQIITLKRGKRRMFRA